MYLLLDLRPSLSMSFLIDFFTSKKISINNDKSNKIFKINKYCKLF